MSPAAWIALGLLSGLGAVARFAVHRAVHNRARTDLPLGTVAVNLSGALLAGAIVGAGAGESWAPVAVGLLGSYTTFSTWMLDSERLASSGRRAWAALNLSVTVVLGAIAFAVGRAVAG